MTIEFNELSGTILRPGTYVENDYVGLLRGLPSGRRKVLLVGHLTTAGSASAGEVHSIGDEETAIDLWGAGSDIARMTRLFLMQPGAQTALLYGMSYAEDGAAVAASGDVVFATAATGPGTWQVWIGGTRFSGGIESGDAVSDIGDRLEAKVNAHPNFHCTASNAAGTVTITARCKGPQGNSIRLRAKITSGIGTTITPTSSTAMTSGATAGTPTTNLANIENQRFHLIIAHTNDTTTLQLFETHIQNVSDAANAKWGIVICGFTGTQAAAVTQTEAIDEYRFQQAWLQTGENPCFELAAAFGGARAAQNDLKRSVNGVVLRGITAPFTETDWPTRTELEVALASGVSACEPQRNGDVEIVRSLHTRQDETESILFRDHNPIEIGDFVSEDMIAIFKARYANAAIKSASPANTPGVLTPTRAKQVVAERLMIFEQLDYVQGTQDVIAGKSDAGKIIAEVNATDATRMDIGYPFIFVAPLGVVAIKQSFTTPSPL
jgi:phage tail sheath gpL-like